MVAPGDVDVVVDVVVDVEVLGAVDVGGADVDVDVVDTVTTELVVVVVGVVAEVVVVEAGAGPATNGKVATAAITFSESAGTCFPSRQPERAPAAFGPRVPHLADQGVVAPPIVADRARRDIAADAHHDRGSGRR